MSCSAPHSARPSAVVPSVATGLPCWAMARCWPLFSSPGLASWYQYKDALPRCGRAHRQTVLGRFDAEEAFRMPSPLPGMDPYIEAPDIWSDFHGDLAAEMR